MESLMPLLDPTPTLVVPVGIAEAAEDAIAHSLSSGALFKNYLRHVRAWPGLTVTESQATVMVLAALHEANDYEPFVLLEDPVDVVRVVARAVLARGWMNAARFAVADWFPQYQELVQSAPRLEHERFEEMSRSLSGY